MVGSVAGDLPEQVKNNQSVNMAAGNGGQKMSQYSWFTVYKESKYLSTTIIKENRGVGNPLEYLALTEIRWNIWRLQYKYKNLPEHLSWEAMQRLAASGSYIAVSD